MEMGVGRRMLKVFSRRPGMMHAAITGFRPAWHAFAKITRGTTTLAELVRTNGVARRALEAMDRA